MILLKNFFLILFISGHLIFKGNGIKLKCTRFFGKRPPCYLYVDLIKGDFLSKAKCCLSSKLLYELQQKSIASYSSTRYLEVMNGFIKGRIDQKSTKQICRNLHIRYHYPTYIHIYSVYPRTTEEKRLYKYVHPSRFDFLRIFRRS
ncbi:Hypothetical protein SRAE_X000051700 [Strongyloides ratti]|uniref:Uncharacterized protein n=1 Tax=Strongyloides ratti TaxID=34506 RepID=A0A090LN03_STRRB|nr:Hypothetical protein SRAE_X000051700 [Strongyloides ratti]CEF71190.1 Hypothetical protein SRAE_X000051700 [Strongyloides ratti]